MVKGISRRSWWWIPRDQRFLSRRSSSCGTMPAGEGVTARELVEEAPPGGAKLCRRRPWAVQPDLAGSFPGGLHPDGRCRDRLGVADGVADLKTARSPIPDSALFHGGSKGREGGDPVCEIGPGGVCIRLDLGPQGVQGVEAHLLAQMLIKLQPQLFTVQVPWKSRRQASTVMSEPF